MPGMSPGSPHPEPAAARRTGRQLRCRQLPAADSESPGESPAGSESPGDSLARLIPPVQCFPPVVPSSGKIPVVYKAAHRKPFSRGGIIFTVLTAIALISGFIPALTAWSGVSVPVTASPAAMTVGTATPSPGFPDHRRIIRTALSVAVARTYTVQPGDYLSGIAARLCGRANDWTGIYVANRRVIGANPDLIFPMQVYVIPRCANPLALLRLAVRPAARSDGDNEGGESSAAAGTAGTPAVNVSPGGTYRGTGAMQQCIITRESGGASQVMNSSGHYGLYQFSYSTWVAHGGSPADFGHATIAEQNAVYYATVAADGYSDWQPYDGC